MTNKCKIRVISICLVWVLWAIDTLFFINRVIDEKDVVVKEGVAISARCIKTRSVNGVEFKVQYTGSIAVIDDFIILPFPIDCDDGLLDKFKNKPIKISYYENHYLGVEVDGQSIRSTADSLGELKDKRGGISFTLFIAIITSFALFNAGKPCRSKSKSGARVNLK